MSPSAIPISNSHDFISAQPASIPSNSNADVFQRIGFVLLQAIFISPPPRGRPYLH